jgi:hypothetical protein
MASRGCSALIKEFNRRKRQKVDGLDKQLVGPPQLTSHTIDLLTKLLSPENLRDQIACLPTSIKTKLLRPSTDIVSQILRHDHVPQTSAIIQGEVTEQAINTILSFTTSTSTLLTKLTSHYADMELLWQFMGWEIGNLLIVVAHWYLGDGLALATRLFNIHRDRGPEYISAHFPMYSPLIEHILKYVQEVRKLKDAKRCQSKNLKDIEDRVHTLRHLHLPEFGNLSPKGAHLIFPHIPLHGIGTSDDSIYKHGQDCFFQAISKTFIAPELRLADNHFNGPKRQQSAVGQNLDNYSLGQLSPHEERTIERGAVMETIVNAYGKDDSILASRDICGLLRSPSSLFDTSHHWRMNDHVVTGKILHHHADTLAPLTTWLGEFVEGHPETKSAAKELGEGLQRLVLQYHGSQPIHPPNPRPQTMTMKPDGFARWRKSSMRDSTPPTLTADTLIDLTENFDLAPLFTIIDEALRKKRGQPAKNTIISRILTGHHPTNGQKQADVNLDHRDPIRFSNVYSRLLGNHFSWTKLRRKSGLSNLLVWMGTGQGFRTASFINNILANHWFESAEQCVQVFRDAAATMVHGNPCDTRIWGQPSNSFGMESKGFTVSTKFKQYFRLEVGEAWLEFLGVQGDHPTPCRTFSAALDLLDSVNKQVQLRGFCTGLTHLQFAVNLVFLGLCQPPEIDDLAKWIFANPKIGAFDGLQLLGFQIKNRPWKWIAAALEVLDEHLQKKLTNEDRDDLHFGTVFIEHLLCKVSRYESILKACKGRGDSMTLRGVVSQTGSQQGASDFGYDKLMIQAIVARYGEE